MNGPDPRTRAIEETRMTAQERIEAALAALPNAHVEEWSIHNTRDFWFWDKKYGVDEAKKIEESIFTLRAYSPDLAAEVLRLRAELADSKQQVEMLERGVIAMGCSNDQLRAELAELKRWRDPVTEPPEEFTPCIGQKEGFKPFVFTKVQGKYYDNNGGLRSFNKWLPIWGIEE